MKKRKAIVQAELIMEYFRDNPNREIGHPEIVDWCVARYKKRTKQVFRDPDRAIRKLSQSGQLIKIKKGIYKYDPDFVINRKLEDFTPEQKERIFKKDNYRCVYCGKGKADGVEIHADHIIPKDLGGKAEIANGQTLCAQHNFNKKNLKQTETGKKMFIHLYELSNYLKENKLKNFCQDILAVYEKYDMNGHIVWEK